MNTFKTRIIATTCAIICALAASAQVVIDIDAALRGAKIGERHYGIFFEEINHAGDGGLYAELIRNRSFEDNTSSPESWETKGNATILLITPGDYPLLNEVQTKALYVYTAQAGSGVRNTGYWGINVVEGRTYKLSFWARAIDAANSPSTLTAALETADGTSLGQTGIAVELGTEWVNITAEITATGNDTQGYFSLTADRESGFMIDMVSLFPPTYKDRPNGCRIDLAEMLEAMNPAFVRFPGGCFVEGQYTNGLTNRFEWKKTIGPIEERPGHRNVNWNYNVTDGLGFHEMLQLTEDLGAEPLFVVNMGMGHGWMVPYYEIEEYIDEAMDAIEYCNGDVTTEWGAKRAANGHPEPFGLQLIEIGNENYNYSSENNNDQSDHYAERYIQFYNAIKAKYPEMVIIGNVEAWSTDNPSWRNPHPVDAVDEHYYRNPEWFVGQYEKYDNYDRSLPKVYVGEYAVTQDYGTTGHLRAALGEAVYMLGMENNADVCIMNSYAPIFANENDYNWKPDMIRFNSNESYGTPSYHVQRLFPNNVGKQNVKWTETGNELVPGTQFGLSTWLTSATFDNVKVTTDNGTLLLNEDFSSGNELWSYTDGSWSVTGGVLQQTSTSMKGAIYLCSVETGSSYTLELDATKTGGDEGFLIAFNYGDANNYCWWNIGGWGNTRHGVEVCTNGSKSTVVSTAGSLVTGRTYRLKIVVNGASAQCYMDEELIHDFTLPIQRKVYLSSNIDEEEGILYVKMVNPNGSDEPVTINLTNATLQSGSVILMTANSSEDENTTNNQKNVYPEEETALTGITGNTVTYTAPAHSLNILRLRVSDIVTNNNAGAASAEAINSFKHSMQSIMSRLNYLHASMTLPTTITSGASIVWSLTEKTSGYVTLVPNAYSYTLTVNALPQGNTLEAATLTANVTFTDGTVAAIDYPVCLAPEDEHYGYLYCFMNPTLEATNYALGSKEDLGKKFNVLLNGQEIFDTEKLAGIEGGTRDAFILRGERPNQYLMTTTDMCNRKSGIWNNYGMNLLRSTDLIHWESTTFDFREGKQIFSDPEATTGCYDTDAEYAKINRVWAPQAIWDSNAEAYLVYYSLLSTNEGDSYDKIYYSYANEDFTTLTQPRMFYDPGYSVIDADISYNPYDGLYHMYYKRESAGGNDRGIYEATSPQLVGGTWTDIAHVTNEGTALVEGSSHIRRINEDVYNLYYMRYSEGYEYKVCETNPVGVNITSSTALMGDGAFQHGSFITLTEEEYKMLQTWSDLTIQLNVYRAYYQDGTTTLDKAIDQADAALAYTTVAELAERLPEAYDNLLKAKGQFKEEILGNLSEKTDITVLLANPDFSAGAEGWLGTTFTDANGYIAEQYNKNFDNYQLLENMPAGYYTLSCQGFYRYGSVDNAKSAYYADEEQHYAMLYINDTSSPLLSIFADQTNYTMNPYTYPDNVATANEAFNTIGTYTGNSVTIELKEPGNLRLGIRKYTGINSDWTIFDNFKLTYEPPLGSDPWAGTPYYLQNVATGTFLVGSHSWGTQASLGKAQMDVLLERQAKNIYTINTLISNGDNKHYLGSNGYVDSAPTNWTFVDKGDGVYAITADGINYIGYDGTLVANLNLTDSDSPNAQWRLVTRDDLLESLDGATSSDPADATFLIRAANFGHNDTRRSSSWTVENAILGYGGDVSNECAEVWNSTFLIYQDLTDIPNGVYKLSMQGFYRVGGGANNGAVAAEQWANGTTQLNAILFANEERLPLMSIMEEAKEGTAPDADNYYKTSNGYIPQSLSGASNFFWGNCYTQELSVVVTDGTLRIGVEKTTASSNDWTCFDNFQLTYMGKSIEIDDAQENFYQEEDEDYNVVTYTRNFKDTHWQPLYVPFQTPYETIKDDFDVAYINNVHQYDYDDNGTTDETLIEAIKIKDGTLKANYPYLIRAKEIGNMTISIPNTTIYATEENSIDCSSVFDTYTFTGIYEATDFPLNEGYYTLSNGEWTPITDDTALGAFRFYMKIESRGIEDKPQALSIRMRIIGDDDEGEGGNTTSLERPQGNINNTSQSVYDLTGRQVTNPTKGIYIVNGKKVIR